MVCQTLTQKQMVDRLYIGSCSTHTTFSFSKAVGILCQCSNFELSAELNASLALLCLLPSPSLALFPSILHPSSLVSVAQPLNLCFRLLRLASGHLNKSSFSVFCCKYSHYRRSLSLSNSLSHASLFPILLPSWHVLCLN